MKTAKRLLETIKPHHYQLEIEPKFDDFSFAAKEIVTFELTQAADYLELHALDLKISRAAINNQTATTIDYKKDDQTVIIKFASQLGTGIHDLELNFSGNLRDDMHGFYRSSYKHDGQEKWLATTQFEPTMAREAFVCVDEPAAKATFDITLIIADHLTAISNMDVMSEAKTNGLKTVRFNRTPKMSAYLVAFLVGEFERITTTNSEGVEVGVYTTPGKSSQGQFALKTAADILSFYTDYFGIGYPLPKLDMVAVPDFAVGAMENWGVVTYRETAILVDPDNTALFNKQYVAMVVAHELAHQWFGNLVTMAWWTDLWLNEGFASWVEYLAVDHLYPEWEMWTQFVSDDYMHARELDALANTHPIEVEVHHPGEIDEIFDAISYQKGASVIRMLYHYIGEEAFRKGLHNYLEHFSYGNAVTADLWHFLEEAAGLPVSRIMTDWTSKPGFPLITFEAERQALTVTQTRFFANPHQPSETDTTWPIPLAFRTPQGQTDPILFDEARLATHNPELGSEKWLKPNPDQTGIFVVNYTPEQLQNLKPALITMTLPNIDRLGLVSDVTALAGSGRLGGEQILELLGSLRQETNFAVWNSMLDGLGELMIMADDGLHDQLEKFARWLVQPRLIELGWEPKPGESHFDTLLRPRLIALAGRCGDEAIMAEARKRFSAHVAGTLIPADLRSAVYGTIARHGSTEDYATMFELYKQVDLQEEGRRLLGALAGFHNVELCQKTLTAALSKDVRAQDSLIVILRVLGNRIGRETAWEYVQSNWDELVKRYGQGGPLLSYVPQGAGVFATQAKADEVEQFFAKHPAPGIERTVKQAIERIRLQADWFERDNVALKQWLDSYKT